MTLLRNKVLKFPKFNFSCPYYSGFHFFLRKTLFDTALTDTSKFVFGLRSKTNLLVSVSAVSEFSPSVMPFKTLFDFIKSCGGRMDLKFSGVALLGLLYSPKWKRSFFSKGKVPFSMAGSLPRAVQESFSVKEIYRWKEDRFVFFYEKKL